MDPLVLVLLLAFVGLPVVSLLTMFAFALTADYEPERVDIRGGTIRGAIASAVAKIVVGDAKTFQLPLVVTLRKTGVFGAATPLLGGATVRDIEWRIFVDGEHVSTVTEASSINVRSAQRILHLPVNAEVHLPRGLVGTWRQYREGRKSGREVQVEVRGHVIVKHWFMSREMPVRVMRHIVLGDPTPTVEVRCQPIGEEPANAARIELRAVNPYRQEVLSGHLRVHLRAERRLRRDPELVAHEEPLHLAPGERLVVGYRATLEPGPRQAESPEDVEAHRVVVRVEWVPQQAAEGVPLDDEPPVVLLRAARPGRETPLAAHLVPTDARSGP